MEEKMINRIGNTKLEFEEIEKINFNKDGINVLDYTYGSGSFLTILCCKP